MKVRCSKRKNTVTRFRSVKKEFRKGIKNLKVLQCYVFQHEIKVCTPRCHYNKVFLSGKESVSWSIGWFYLGQEWPVFVLGHSFDSSQQRIPLEMQLQLMQAKTQFSSSFSRFLCVNLFLNFKLIFNFLLMENLTAIYISF